MFPRNVILQSFLSSSIGLLSFFFFFYPPLPLFLRASEVYLTSATRSTASAASDPISIEEDDQPLFLEEIGQSSHGKKHWYDYLIEADPGSCIVQTADDYEQNVPQKIAVLPFSLKGSAKFSINGLKIDPRKEDLLESWKWTIAQRARRVFHGFLSAREFDVIPLSTIDSILLRKKIGTDSALKALKPEILGQWLGADCLVYGEIYPYQRFYLVMGSGIRIKMSIKIVSSKTGKVLLSGSVNRNYLDINPRFDPVDIAVSSVLTLSTLRDINLRRAEDEACRELALRIPLSPRKAYPVLPEKENSFPKPLALRENESLVKTDEQAQDNPPESCYTEPPKAWAVTEKKSELQRFFLPEQHFIEHSKKKKVDYLLDVDPSHFKCSTSAFLMIEQPMKFAILPFIDDATKGKFVINGIPLSLRSKERRAQMRWTIANRLRRGIACYLAQRDWEIQSLDLTDNILKAHGWKKASDMLKTDPTTLGDWLGVDCVVYGRVSSMMSIYALMYSACRVGIEVKLVSTKSSKSLVEVSGSRTESSFAPALDPLDIAVSSVTTALLIRDVTFKRAEDEVCREIVARIPSTYKENNRTN
ncbi:DUF799 family lipoprotein [Methylacidiphilum caldifontis]|uniref:GNA1162 family protein n=1 Tax=Methylacidiphilum caldifontis TaxID=2795386 RepID=UPI001A90968C|nr:GNA1162 family protein [Methylacidiphilum caldifontis]QSR89376.1 DUF799 family lipoprotein [Methylacidiphilum caldifontis]